MIDITIAITVALAVASAISMYMLGHCMGYDKGNVAGYYEGCKHGHADAQHYARASAKYRPCDAAIVEALEEHLTEYQTGQRQRIANMFEDLTK